MREIADQIPSIERVVVVPYLNDEPDLVATSATRVRWDEFAPRTGPPPPLAFEQLPFDHPLYIMYSSGTTGLPKCMVHGAGGTLLQHLKELVLHTDLRRDDRIFYFTTCGWMMWNWLVSSLAVGATVVLYDGAPFIRRRHDSLGHVRRGAASPCSARAPSGSRSREKDGLAAGRDARPARAEGDPLDRQPARRRTATTTCIAT